MLKAIEKFIEVISGAVGKLWKPVDLMIMTKVTKKSLAELGYNIDEHFGSVEIHNGELSVEIDKFQRSLPSEVQYLVGVELRKQENLDIIFEKTLQLLKDIPDNNVSAEEVADTWMLKFIESSSYSTEDMVRNMWSKILADEICSPGTYSLRTIKVLETMTKSDAEAFKRIASKCFKTVITIGEFHFIPASKKIRDKMLIDFADVMLLEEIGLLVTDKSITIRNNMKIIIYGNTLFCPLIKSERNMPIYKITSIGNELLRLVNVEKVKLEDSMYKEIFKLNGNETINLHKMLGSTSYQTIPYKVIM